MKVFVVLFVASLFWGCAAKEDYPGVEYAPQMYHSVPYEPLTQIRDKESGQWLSNREDGLGEFYNSNPNNPYAMNMREPVAGTVRRTGYLPYRLPKDSLEYAAVHINNPLDSTEVVLAEGQVLYERFCEHCHGNGKVAGSVGEIYGGVPAYNAGRVKELSEGHIFHVITHGKGLMGAHGSQIAQGDRWKIVRYVQTLQNQE